jgi:hypothetical protein
MVDIRRPSMQNMRIRQELNIAHLQNHMQTKSVAIFLKDLECFNLGFGQGRNDSGVGEAA